MQITPAECTQARRLLGAGRNILGQYAETDQYELAWYEAITALDKAIQWTEDLRSAAKYDLEFEQGPEDLRLAA